MRRSQLSETVSDQPSGEAGEVTGTTFARRRDPDRASSRLLIDFGYPGGFAGRCCMASRVQGELGAKKNDVKKRTFSGPSEYSVYRFALGVAAVGPALGISRSFRVPHPVKYRSLGQAIPLCRCAISPGCVVFPQRTGLEVVKPPVPPSLRVQPSSRAITRST